MKSNFLLKRVLQHALQVLRATCIFITVAMAGAANAQPAPTSAPLFDPAPAIALRAQHLAMRDRLATNSFGRPLALESFHSSKDVRGDIYAVIPTEFGKFSDSLETPQAWCDVLILHLNTKYCRSSVDKNATLLTVNVGKKLEQPLADSFRVVFAWKATRQKSDYLNILLTAATGPLSTHDYRITLEAIPLENGSSFLHLSYAYGYGLTGRLAIVGYFSTVGRAKIGFTVVSRHANGKITYVDGIRGLAERNTMRYYLAIESYLGALAQPAHAQFEKRINDWFTATEQYSQQLHEVEKQDYLAMKRNENRRQ